MSVWDVLARMWTLYRIAAILEPALSTSAVNGHVAAAEFTEC